MEQLRIRQKVAQQKKKDAAVMKEIEGKLAGLQAEYEVLAARASNLRSKQYEDHLKYKLITGEEKDLPTGQIVSYFYPNQLSWLQRAGLFLRRLWGFVSDEPREANTEGGIFPAIFGTFTMTLLLSIAVTPFGVLAAIYLREYAKQGLFVSASPDCGQQPCGRAIYCFWSFWFRIFCLSCGRSIDRLFFTHVFPTSNFRHGRNFMGIFDPGSNDGSCGDCCNRRIACCCSPRSPRRISCVRRFEMADYPTRGSPCIRSRNSHRAHSGDGAGSGRSRAIDACGRRKTRSQSASGYNYPLFHLNQKFMHLGFHIFDLGFQSPDSEAAKPMVFASYFLFDSVGGASEPWCDRNPRKPTKEVFYRSF